MSDVLKGIYENIQSNKPVGQWTEEEKKYFFERQKSAHNKVIEVLGLLNTAGATMMGVETTLITNKYNERQIASCFEFRSLIDYLIGQISRRFEVCEEDMEKIEKDTLNYISGSGNEVTSEGGSNWEEIS